MGLALASSDLIEMRKLTNELNVGVLFPGLEPAQIADTLNELLASPSRVTAFRSAAFEAARTIFNWERESQVFLYFLRRFT